MPLSDVRRSPIAGRWYPGSAGELRGAVDGCLAAADSSLSGDIVALIAPHAGLMYSGGVAAHAYRLLADRRFDVAVLVGPSHFVAFDGVALYRTGGFETPLGVADIDRESADRLRASSPVICERPEAHRQEHSLEMQLPFLQRVAPATPIVPLLMGRQDPATADALAEALASVLRGRNVLLIASTDLSHYHDAVTASRLDSVVVDCVAQFDEDRLQAALVARPDHACGGGPAVAVMRAARMLGATDAAVLDYADSGDVTGDKSSVVGYMAAALGRFVPSEPR
jgi:AmmeMemoRadiSam system protein B